MKHAVLLDAFVKFHCRITLFWCNFQVKMHQIKIIRVPLPIGPFSYRITNIWNSLLEEIVIHHILIRLTVSWLTDNFLLC